MRVLVCIKQVPDTTRVKIDEKTGSLLRDGVDSKTNVYDLHALEAALTLKAARDCHITALTMGPPQAEAAIHEALALGADHGCLLSDSAFPGADVLATSYALAQAVRKLGDFDLILCGKQTTDGDTAQVGPALAEQLGLPHAAWVTEISDIAADAVTVAQDMGACTQRVRLPLPCLLTVEKGPGTPRLPSLRRKRALADAAMARLTLADLPDSRPDRYGADGSPTRVERIFPPPASEGNILLEGDADTLTNALLDTLTARKLI